MEFYIQHIINGSSLESWLINTKDSDFCRNISGYCYHTGSEAKDTLTFEIAKRVRENQKDYFEIEVSVEIELKIFFGFNKWPGEFSGSCSAKFNYILKPTDPGLYEKNFKNVHHEIGDCILGKYQEFLDILDI